MVQFALCNKGPGLRQFLSCARDLKSVLDRVVFFFLLFKIAFFLFSRDQLSTHASTAKSHAVLLLMKRSFAKILLHSKSIHRRNRIFYPSYPKWLRLKDMPTKLVSTESSIVLRLVGSSSGRARIWILKNCRASMGPDAGAKLRFAVSDRVFAIADCINIAVCKWCNC